MQAALQVTQQLIDSKSPGVAALMLHRLQQQADRCWGQASGDQQGCIIVCVLGLAFVFDNENRGTPHLHWVDALACLNPTPCITQAVNQPTYHKTWLSTSRPKVSPTPVDLQTSPSTPGYGAFQSSLHWHRMLITEQYTPPFPTHCPTCTV